MGILETHAERTGIRVIRLLCLPLVRTEDLDEVVKSSNLQLATSRVGPDICFESTVTECSSVQSASTRFSILTVQDVHTPYGRAFSSAVTEK